MTVIFNLYKIVRCKGQPSKTKKCYTIKLKSYMIHTFGDAGYWMLDTGYWILDTGYWILDTGYWILDT